jgi:hypothetical protein
MLISSIKSRLKVSGEQDTYRPVPIISYSSSPEQEIQASPRNVAFEKAAGEPPQGEQLI